MASRNDNLLPIVPHESETVYTHYWVDNFNIIVEKTAGGGAISTTHLVAYQKQSSNSERRKVIIDIPRKKGRKLLYNDVNIDFKPVDKNVEPQRNMTVASITFDEILKEFNKLFLLWLYTRKTNNINQIVPIFKDWALKTKPSIEINQTVEACLPPITLKVTDFKTIQKCLTYLQKLSRTCYMPYVNITVDVGVAINAYKTVWTYPKQYRNIIIHLGSFHFLKENFQVT